MELYNGLILSYQRICRCNWSKLVA